MAQGSAHCGVPRALPFGNPQTFVYEKSVETRFQLQKTSVLRRRQMGNVWLFHFRRVEFYSILVVTVQNFHLSNLF